VLFDDRRLRNEPRRIFGCILVGAILKENRPAAQAVLGLEMATLMAFIDAVRQKALAGRVRVPLTPVKGTLDTLST